MKNYIYVIKDPDTDEVVYVGKTKNPERRYKDHTRRCIGKYRSLLDRWKNELLKSNRLPKMNIIKECDSTDVDFWEKYYISEYRKSQKILNMTDGGDGLQNPSDEVRRKIGEKSKGRILNKESRKKISDSNFNSGIEIICYDINKNFIGKFSNARRASEQLGVGYKNISKILNGTEYFIKKYTFFRSNDDSVEEKLNDRVNRTVEFGQVFFRISKNGGYKEYHNLMIAAMENDCNFRNIWLCLAGYRKTCSGYIWSYSLDFDLSLFSKSTNAKGCRLIRNGEVFIFSSINPTCVEHNDASVNTGMHKSSICNYLKGKKNPIPGDVWEYIN